MLYPFRFASFTKSVVNKATKNVAVENSKVLAEYRAQIADLQRQLAEGPDGQMVSSPPPPLNPPLI